MFGYAFHSDWTPDATVKDAEPYRHPHSFYFSGYPMDPPNAPIVSQNYTEFSMIKPDPTKTWDLVAKMSKGQSIPFCNFFNKPKCSTQSSRQKENLSSAENPPNWSRGKT